MAVICTDTAWGFGTVGRCRADLIQLKSVYFNWGASGRCFARGDGSLPGTISLSTI
jgi:hypothetical protein